MVYLDRICTNCLNFIYSQDAASRANFKIAVKCIEPRTRCSLTALPCTKACDICARCAARPSPEKNLSSPIDSTCTNSKAARAKNVARSSKDPNLCINTSRACIAERRFHVICAAKNCPRRSLDAITRSTCIVGMRQQPLQPTVEAAAPRRRDSLNSHHNLRRFSLAINAAK